jgi:hypothetical protein
MAKFYVQCGSFREVVTADDAEKAALWGMHIIMEKVLPLDELDWVETQDLAVAKYKSGFTELGEQVLVSERGFDRDECGKFETEPLLKEWNQLLVAVARIDRMLQRRK